MVNLESNKQKRIEWIDALKGFLIFCVTLGHCNMWAPIERYIYSFHMFIFFFLAGFLFSVKKTTKEILTKCSKRLLLPFVAWNFVSAMIDFLLQKDLTIFIEELFVLNGNLTWNAPIWFLLVLFITELLFVCLRLYKHTWISIIALVASLGLWILIGSEWIIWKINLVPMAMAFFILGWLFKATLSTIQRWCLIIPFGVGSIVFSALNVRVVYTYGVFGNYIYCILAAFCGVLFFVGLFSKIRFLSSIPFLKSWGKNSLIIMATQFFVFRLISVLSAKIININLMHIQNSAISLCISLFTISTITLGVMLFKRLSNRVKVLKAFGSAFGINYPD